MSRKSEGLDGVEVLLAAKAACEVCPRVGRGVEVTAQWTQESEVALASLDGQFDLDAQGQGQGQAQGQAMNAGLR